jgi:hypothetical protein
MTITDTGTARQAAHTGQAPPQRAIATWIFVRAAQSVRLARIASSTPQVLVIGPDGRRQLHVSRSEEDLGLVQMALERRLQRYGWSYEGCIHG